MRITQKVKKILDWYEGDPPGVKANLARILSTGKLGGTGKVVILPVDQGFEHGPARSFAPNPPAYDPHYHYQLAIEAGLNAYAAPLGMIAAGADTFAGAIPTILKCNNSNSLATNKDQAVTAGVKDALRLGCAAIGFTIYPGSEYAFAQMEELRELTAEAKAAAWRSWCGAIRAVPNLIGRRDRPRYLRLCRADGRPDGCQHHQGEAADCGDQPGGGEEDLRRRSTARPSPSASSTSCSARSTAAASWCSPAARQRTSTASSRKCAASATAAPTAASSAATPSSARRRVALEMLNKIIDIYLGKA